MEVERFEEFFRQFYEKDLLQAASQGKKSIEIDFSLLDKFDPELADKLLNDPEAILEVARQAISAIDLPEGSVKIEPRFKNLPEQQNIRIRNLRSKHIGKFVSLDGVVKRASEVKPEVATAIFECPDCGNKIHVLQTERTLIPPNICDCGRKGKFNLINKKLFDARIIVIEEPFEIVTSEKPGNVTIYLKEDLTTPELQRKTDPGTRLRVNGVLKELEKSYKGRTRIQLDVYVDANYIEPTEIEWEELIISNIDEDEIKKLAADPNTYDNIIASIAPSMYGLTEVKEAIAYQMFGGMPREVADGTRIRGDIHILLVGDPAIGKTQLLKLVSNLIPRGKYVSGKGVTGVGLTASVVRDEEFMGGWVLEAGAMVLCNKGIICIDEFDKMNKDDQIAMHEAMSTQTISVAKASIVATLPARTAVLGGANPKFSRFDPYRPIIEQVDVPDTLLSRFDLKFVLKDVPDKKTDEKLADHIIETRMKEDTAKPLISNDLLRKYIAYARHNCRPEMTKEALERIKQFYIDMRHLYAGDETITVAITLRQYESLMRLAEAAARIRLRDEVTVEDADRAIKLMRRSIEQLGYDYETGKIDIDRTEGTPSSQRSKIHTILDIIERLEKQLGKQIPKEELIATAQDEGVKESEVEDLLQRLKREGLLFEPKPNFIQRI